MFDALCDYNLESDDVEADIVEANLYGNGLSSIQFRSMEASMGSESL